MIFKIEDGLYYDNNKMYIIKGDERKDEYLRNYEMFDFPKEGKSRAKYPTLIFLSSTTCNLECKYCFADKGTYRDVSKKTSFTKEDYIEIFNTVLKKSGGVQAISFFGGEPIVNIKEIEKFVEYMYEIYDVENIPPMSISTNGTIMNDSIKDFIVKYGIAIGTSLDGIKEHNDINRIGCGINSVYDSVERTLHILSENNIRTGLQFTVNHSHITNYQKGDYMDWIKKLENLGIDSFEIVAVTSNLEDIQINMNDEKIFTNYTMLCNDISEYSLNALVTGETTRIPNVFIGTIISIVKRLYQKECGAGKSFSFSPDKRIYPCHVCASDEEYGCDFDENYLDNTKVVEKFMEVKNMTKKDFHKCNKCIASSVCTYFCKAMMEKMDYELLEPRCYMMQVFMNRTIKFLAHDFNDNRFKIEANVAKIYASRLGTVNIY